MKADYLDYHEDDVRSFWQGTYVGLRDNNVVQAWYVSEVFTSPVTHKVSLLLHRGHESKKIGLNNPNLISHLPDVGMVQLGKNSAFSSYKAARQWKKGLRLSALDFDPVCCNLSAHDISRHFSHNAEAMDSFYSHEYKSIREAVKLINREGYNSVALSKNLSVASVPEYRQLILCYREDIIGAVINLKPTITEDSRQFFNIISEELEVPIVI